MESYLFNWRNTMDSSSNSRCIMNLGRWSSKQSKLLALQVKKEIFTYKLIARSKWYTIQLGEKTVKSFSSRWQIMFITIFIFAWKRKPSRPINDQLLIISAETYKVLSIISEFTKRVVWALNLINSVTWHQIFIETPSMVNLQELNYTCKN